MVFVIVVGPVPVFNSETVFGEEVDPTGWVAKESDEAETEVVSETTPIP